MNFDFSPDQQELRDTVARALGDGGDWQTLADLGLFALIVPESAGGMGMSLVDLALIAQELGAQLAPLAITDTLIATDLIARYGTDAQRVLLPEIALGNKRIALAWHEADAGFGANDLTASTISGQKVLVADASKADLFLIATGAGLALVDRAEITAHNSLDPACDHHFISFTSAQPFGDHAARARMFDVAATFNSGMMIGIAEKLLGLAAAYARERVQFDKPIGSYQGIKHKCADMATAVEAMKSVAYYAFWAVAEDAPDRAGAVSMAKAWCGNTASKVGADAAQIHGGMGFTWELGLHRYLRRTKVLAATYGDASWHRERVVSEALANMAEA